MKTLRIIGLNRYYQNFSRPKIILGVYDLKFPFDAKILDKKDINGRRLIKLPNGNVRSVAFFKVGSTLKITFGSPDQNKIWLL